MILQLLIVACYLACIAQAFVEHANSGALSHYNLLHPSDPELVVEFLVFIKQLNLDKIQEELIKVSSPSSESYGMHWTREQVSSFTANVPSAQAVRDYLKKNGLTETRHIGTGHYIYASGTVANWEKLLGATFNQYALKISSNSAAASLKEHTKSIEYTMPVDLEEHVSSIYGVSHFPLRSNVKPQVQLITPPAGETASVAAAAAAAEKRNLQGTSPTPNALTDGYVTPALLHKHYGMSDTILNNAHNAATTQAVYASINQNFSPDDLAVQQRYLHLPSNVAKYVGPTTPSSAAPYAPYDQSSVCKDPSKEVNCGESNLDIQYITATGSKVSSYFMYDDNAEFLLPWLTAINTPGGGVKPDVISISYGASESDLNAQFAAQFDIEAQKIGLTGTTLFASSGDDGAPGSNVYNNGNPDCTIGGGYNPQWPASSIYVVSVGATMGPEAQPPKEEIVCASNTGGGITSGGGFSTLIARPTWQDSAINKYLSLYTPSDGFATNGRAYPDMALVGYKYFVVIGDYAVGESGTSASSPSLAGMVSLINAERNALGKSSLGWMTKAIYDSAASGDIFPTWARDITSGDNKCTRQKDKSTPPNCCTQGFNAVSGWDPVTGFGVPHFPDFYKYFVNLGGGATTHKPSFAPTVSPTLAPVTGPTLVPTSLSPTLYPTDNPTYLRTSAPSTGGVPTAAPTAIPTAMPTVFGAPTKQPSPTAVPTLSPVRQPNIDLLVKQSIHLVDYNAYLAEQTICNKAIKEAIIRVMDAVNITNAAYSADIVTSLFVTDLESSPSRQRRYLSTITHTTTSISARQQRTSRALLQTGILVDYILLFYEQGQTTAQVEAVLISAVDNGEFTYQLNKAAHAYGASALYTATTSSGDITITDVNGGVPPTPTSTKKSNALNINIVIAISAAALILIIGGCMYYRLSKKLEILEGSVAGSRSESMTSHITSMSQGQGQGQGYGQGSMSGQAPIHIHISNPSSPTKDVNYNNDGQQQQQYLSSSSYNYGRESNGNGDGGSDSSDRYSNGNHIRESHITSSSVINPMITSQDHEDRNSASHLPIPSSPLAPRTSGSGSGSSLSATTGQNFMSGILPNSSPLKGRGPLRPGSSTPVVSVGGAKQAPRPVNQKLANGESDL